MRNLISFMVKAHHLPIKPMIDSANFDVERSGSLAAPAGTHPSKNNLLASPGNAADDVYSQSRLSVMISAQIFLDQSRCRNLLNPSNSGSSGKGISAKDWPVYFPWAEPSKLL